jgi:hypothetical protein
MAAAQHAKGKLTRDTLQPDKLKPIRRVFKKSGDGGKGQSSISSFFGKQALAQGKAGADAQKQGACCGGERGGAGSRCWCHQGPGL